MSDAPDSDPLDELAERLLEDLDREEHERGSLEWMRSVLRQEDATDPLIGQLFEGKYRILRLLGRGGFGAVYEAVDERGAGNRVALKIQLPGFGAASDRLASFRAEALRVTRLSHPHIVDWKSFDETRDGGSYFVMELVDGRPLSELIRTEGPLEWRRAAELLLQVLSALEAAHSVGSNECILHLDLKPRNVLVVPPRDGRPEQAKVIDFGIGQHLGRASDEEPPPVPAVPAQGSGALTTSVSSGPEVERRSQALGFPLARAYTAEYASPEHCVHVRHADGEELEPLPLDARADLYSLGVIAYELLTGRLPYAHPALRAGWLEAHLSSPLLPWTREESARLPRPLRQLVERLLARDREDRPGSAREAADVLRRLLRPSLLPRLLPAAVLLVVLGGLLARSVMAPPPPLQLVDSRERAPRRVWYEAGAPLPELHLLEAGAGIEPLVLLDANGRSLPGWSARVEEARVLLAPEAASPVDRRSVLSRVSLEAPGTGSRSESFDLILLPRGAREGSLSLAGEPVEALASRPLKIDPEGLEVALHLPRLALDDLDTAAGSLEVAGASVPISAGASEGGGCIVRATLGRAPEGPARLDLQVPVGDGPPLLHSVPVEVVSRALAPRVSWVDRQGRELAWGAGGVRVDSTRKVRVHTDRAAGVRSPQLPELRVEVDAPTQGVLPQAELTLPADWLAEAPTTIELRLDDGVLCSPLREALHRPVLELPIRVLETEAFELFNAPASTSVPGGTATRYHDGRSPLLLTGLADIDPARSALRVQAEGGPEVRLAASASGGAPDLTPLLGKLGVIDEGPHGLRVSRWALDPAGERILPAPVASADLDLRLDRTAPALTIDAGPRRLTPFGLEGPDLAVEVQDASPWRLTWQVLQLDSSPATELQERPGLPGAGPVLLGRLEAEGVPRLVDGRYRLSVSVQDAAGNSAPATVVPLEVARTGPRITPLSPAEELNADTSSWPMADGQLVQVSAEVFDPNGVSSVTCRARRSNSPEQELLLQAAPSAPGGAWSWRLAPPTSWSEAADIQLLFTARDSTGRLATRTHGPFRLPRIREQLPGRVDDLLLLPGTEGAPYTLHGRAETQLENLALEGDGLPAFWVPPGLERPGLTESPWAIPVAQGQLEPYYLAEHEVTCEAYLSFLRSGNGYASGSWWRELPPRAQRRRALIEALESRPPERPATGIWHAEAEAYARWRGLRLPTLLELEHAIRAGQQWRTRSWDADGSDSYDPADPFHRVRGLSTGAEWTSSPARTDGAGGHVRPRGPLDFLPGASPGESYWISGATAGNVAQSRAAQRHDFAVLDIGTRRHWSNREVGFRLAASARELLAARPGSPGDQAR